MARIIFFGSDKIGAPSLEALLKSRHEIACVVTAPDKRKGRHLFISQTPIKEIAAGYKIPVSQPEKLLSSKAESQICDLGCDLFIVFAYGKILPKSFLTIPKFMPLNIHASILPKYRGAAPIQRALMNGEKNTGITFIKMDEKMDEGDMISTKEIDIFENDNALSLEEKISKLAADYLLEVIEKVISKRVNLTKQDGPLATYAPKLKKEDGKVSWDKPARQIVNQIKGCFGWPGTFTHYNKTLIKIWGAKIEKIDTSKEAPGKILQVNNEGILVSTTENALLISELQAFSGKRLLAKAFVQGHNIKAGGSFC